MAVDTKNLEYYLMTNLACLGDCEDTSNIWNVLNKAIDDGLNPADEKCLEDTKATDKKVRKFIDGKLSSERTGANRSDGYSSDTVLRNFSGRTEYSKTGMMSAPSTTFKPSKNIKSSVSSEATESEETEEEEDDSGDDEEEASKTVEVPSFLITPVQQGQKAKKNLVNSKTIDDEEISETSDVPSFVVSSTREERKFKKRNVDSKSVGNDAKSSKQRNADRNDEVRIRHKARTEKLPPIEEDRQVVDYRRVFQSISFGKRRRETTAIVMKGSHDSGVIGDIQYEGNRPILVLYIPEVDFAASTTEKTQPKQNGNRGGKQPKGKAKR
jgi:hypothetical protein